MWLLIAFLAVPLIEIGLFIQIGGLIGLWPTLLVVVVTAIAGTFLVRSQGIQTMHNLRGSFSSLSDPTEPLAHGAMILFSGALLLTPGFITDAVGFALLVPGIRSFIFRKIKSRVNVQSFTMGTGFQDNPPPREPQTANRVIDGDFEDVTEAKHPTHPPSGWTKH